MTEPAVSLSDQREEMMAVPACALCGAFVLSMFAFLLFNALPIFGFDVEMWILTVPGGLIGLLLGAYGGWYWVCQRRLMREVTAKMGFKPLSDKLKDEMLKRVRSLCSRRVTLSNAMGRSLGKARLVIAVMSTDSDDHSSDSSSTKRETIAFYESKSLDLPQFNLAPEGLLLRFFAAATGLRDINFEDSPDFSRNYHLSGEVEGPIRALFSPEVRDHFVSRRGLQLAGQKSRLLLLRPSEISRPNEIEEFVRDAVKTFRLLNASEQNVADYYEEHGPVTEEDVLVEFEKTAGPNAKRTQATTFELNEFLSQPVPRELTPSMKHKYAPDLFSRLFGLILGICGIVFLVISLAADVDAKAGPVMGGIGLALTAIGVFTIWAAGISGRRTTALLRNGVHARGRVDNVNATSIVIGSRRYVARVRYKFDGSTQRSTCNLYGQDVMVAQRLADDDQTANVMVDPQDSTRILLLDTLTLTR
jgi:hypothetical protein